MTPIECAKLAEQLYFYGFSFREALGIASEYMMRDS